MDRFLTTPTTLTRLSPLPFIGGATFGIEYLDQRGWASTRTIRCIALDPARPALLQAYCNVRKTTRMFRLDRIISTTNLRTGVTTQNGAQSVLFAPAFLPDEPCCAVFLKMAGRSPPRRVRSALPGYAQWLAVGRRP